jgi:hypothetical protein
MSKLGMGFQECIDNLDKSMDVILELFNNIGQDNQKNIEEKYFKEVGNFSKHLKQLLNIYFDDNTKRDTQLQYKPQILYFRQVQHYLVFILRYPDILTVYEHDEIKQTKNFLENKDYLIDLQYKKISEHQTELFDGDFRKILDEKLSNALR